MLATAAVGAPFGRPKVCSHDDPSSPHDTPTLCPPACGTLAPAIVADEPACGATLRAKSTNHHKILVDPRKTTDAFVMMLDMSPNAAIRPDEPVVS